MNIKTTLPAFCFASTLFLSALLMFSIQPMYGKMLLPLLGGTPATWNTCMVFYQSLLFFAYLYAHWLGNKFKINRQIPIHLALAFVSLQTITVSAINYSIAPIDNNPNFWLIQTLFIAIGLPFFVISTTAPLLQKWFSISSGTDPNKTYYLYAASNAGSLTALLSYPLLIEPQFGLNDQREEWSIAYIFLYFLIVLCAIYTWQHDKKAEKQIETVLINKNQKPGRLKQLHWLVLAFVPSSLLLGITQFISTDVAAVPLLWIIPLSLYLISFILVFSKWANKFEYLFIAIQPILILALLAYSYINPVSLPLEINITIHLLVFFSTIMVCHGQLAKSRPNAEFLTQFYLIMSLGGLLGSLFNTFLAPILFNDIYEYPIMIVSAILLRPGLIKHKWPYKTIIITLIFAVFFSTDYEKNLLKPYLDYILVTLIFITGISYSFRNNPACLAVITGALLFINHNLQHNLADTIYKKRSFFGVLSVAEQTILSKNQPPETLHKLYHGTTIHGLQRLSSNHLNEPLSYFSYESPIGQLFEQFNNENNHWQIGIVGLGAGSLACYSKPLQNWQFFEINPQVVEIAKNKNLFKFISDCNPYAKIIVGDARLSLNNSNQDTYDLLIIDAFSSDAIPTHLLTQEAIQLYFTKLKRNGLLALHITNRYLELKKVLENHINNQDLYGLYNEYSPSKKLAFSYESDWIVISKNPEQLLKLQNSYPGQWNNLLFNTSSKTWTDDYTPLIGLWK